MAAAEYDAQRDHDRHDEIGPEGHEVPYSPPRRADAPDAPHVLEQHLDKHDGEEDERGETAQHHACCGGGECAPCLHAYPTDVETCRQPDDTGHESEPLGFHDAKG